ncbi:MAG TPA: glycosyltransferase family 9 protein [Puia sp.]|jgi:heptosyltransferase-2|nr:glycosyltransferase family 9 protein [Puia sp.]
MSKDQQLSYRSLSISSKPWKEAGSTCKVLAIRLQAMGDVIITLPYLRQLKNCLPDGSTLDLLSRKECVDIPSNTSLFNKIYSIGGGRNYKRQLLYSSLLLPTLFFNGYDVVIDLQNNIVSRFIRKSLMPKAWSEFDRFSPVSAGERTRLTIEASGLGDCFANSNLKLRNEKDGINILLKNGWNGDDDLVILNPAGAFETRNWPINNYVCFANHWLSQFPKTKFVIMGLEGISSKADYLKSQLGEKLINLVKQTTTSQAFVIVQLARLVLSEDSGLMHMAWVSDVPTFALFGSTRSDWARPLGSRSFFLDSSDLACGPCMREHCKYGDTHCLTRYTAGMVYEKAVLLVNSLR